MSDAIITAWDSEGRDAPDGSHRLIGLQSSEGWACWRDSLGASDLGAWAEALLTRSSRQRWHVAYGLAYDAAMWLAVDPSLSWERGQALWAGQWTQWLDWWVRYLPRRSFTLAAPSRTDPSRPSESVRVTIADLLPCCRESMLAALGRRGYASVDPVAWCRMETGKRGRASFAEWSLDDIAAYTRSEVDALAWLARRLEDEHDLLGAPVRRALGPGGIARRWLDAGSRYAIPFALDGVEAAPNDAARGAYFGGRTETLRYGDYRDRPIWQADIRSAYPWALAQAPGMMAGRWERTTRWTPGPPGRLALWAVRWSFTGRHAWYPFAFRAEGGSIWHPPAGSAWAHDAEVAVAMQGPWRPAPEVLDGWIWHPDDPDERPFAWLRDRYQQRLDTAQTDPGLSHLIKLALVATYGVMAQSRSRRRGRKPRWHCLELAGWVTSRIRARVMEAALTVPDSHLLAFSTDAIMADRSLGHLASAGLGGWDVVRHQGVVLLDAQQHWSGVGPERVRRTRGWPADAVHPAEVLAGWRRASQMLSIPVRRFIGVGEGSMTEESWSRFARWVTEPRRLRLHPGLGWARRTEGDHQRMRWRTVPCEIPGDPYESGPGHAISVPWPLPWVPPATGEEQRLAQDHASRQALDDRRMDAEMPQG